MKRKRLSKRGLLLKILKNSLNNKRKAGWERNIGAGFIKEDIIDIDVFTKTKSSWILIIKMGPKKAKNYREALTLITDVKNLNIRETEEALKWVQENLKEVL